MLLYWIKYGYQNVFVKSKTQFKCRGNASGARRRAYRLTLINLDEFQDVREENHYLCLKLKRRKMSWNSYFFVFLVLIHMFI